jgi:hypothetical protein
VIKTALGVVSVRQAAARYGIGISAAVLWVRRARFGEAAARRQGQPRGSKLDEHAAFQSSRDADPLKGGAQRFGWHRHAPAFLPRASDHGQKTAHACERDRPDIRAAREAWFDGQLDLDPEWLVFIDETSASTKMARLYGRCARG